MLTGFAIALNGPLHAKFVRYEHLSVALVSWIPVLGVVISLIGQITTLAGLLHMRRIYLSPFTPPLVRIGMKTFYDSETFTKPS
jgi:hypothetical protein